MPFDIVAGAFYQIRGGSARSSCLNNVTMADLLNHMNQSIHTYGLCSSDIFHTWAVWLSLILPEIQYKIPIMTLSSVYYQTTWRFWTDSLE